MKKICTLGLFLALIVVSSPVFSESESKKLQRECIEPTVNIDSRPLNYGTGAVIRSEATSDDDFMNVAVTCAHILGPAEINVRYYRFDDENPIGWSEMHRGMMYIKDDERDVAVVFFRTKKQLPVAILDADIDVKRGNLLWAVGCAVKDMPPRVEEGKVHHSDGKNIIGSARLAFGDSGGPTFTFRDDHYRIIGINNSTYVLNQTVMSFIANYKSTKNFVSLSREHDDKLKFVLDVNEKMPELPGIFLKVQKLSDRGPAEHHDERTQP